MEELPPRFKRGNLVWRDVLCHSNNEFRKKLVLEAHDCAYDSYGIELLCHKIVKWQQVDEVRGHKIYDVDLGDRMVPVQKVCNHIHHNSDGSAQEPLYFPRPTEASSSRIQLTSRQDFDYFISLPQPAMLKGNFDTMYIKDRVSGRIQLKQTLYLTFRMDDHHPSSSIALILDDCFHLEKTGIWCSGAIHGEVRMMKSLTRMNGDVCNPKYDVDTTLEPIAIKTVRKASLHITNGSERPFYEIQTMYNIRLKNNGKEEFLSKLVDCIIEDTATDVHSSGSCTVSHSSYQPNDSTNMHVDSGDDSDGNCCSEQDDMPAVGDVELSQVDANGNAYIVMPYFNGGELFCHLDYLQHERSIVLDYSRIHRCFCQLVQAVECLHRSRYNHRDISCENVLLHRDKDGMETSNIIDYGMSLFIPQGNDYITGRRVCGKVLYIPPEHFLDENVNTPTLGFAADIWALGVILFMLVTARGPFDNRIHNDPRIRAKYKQWLESIKYNRIGEIRCVATPVQIYPNSPSFDIDPNTPLRLKNHPCYNLLRGLLTWPEQDRITIDKIKTDNWYLTGGVSDYRGTHNPTAQN